MTILEITSQTWLITIIGYVVIFIALVLLIVVFSIIPKILQRSQLNQLKKEGKVKEDTEPSDLEISGDENAAIAMALHLYFNELHDEESNVITIKNIERKYSPWSSKIYSMNNTQHYQRN